MHGQQYQTSVHETIKSTLVYREEDLPLGNNASWRYNACVYMMVNVREMPCVSSNYHHHDNSTLYNLGEHRRHILTRLPHTTQWDHERQHGERRRPA